MTNSLRRVLAASVLFIVTLRLCAVILPWPRLWGIDFFRDQTTIIVVLFSLLPLPALLLLHPRWQQSLTAFSSKNGHNAAVLILVILIAATFLFPMKTFFYGDGGTLIPQIHLYSIGQQYDAQLLTDLKSAPLAGLLLLAAMHIVPAIYGLTGLFEPVTAMYPFGLLSLVSLLAVVSYVVFVLPRRERLRASFLVSGSAGVLLYFGYAEFYAPVFAAVIIYLLEGERVLRRGTSLVPLFIVYAACLATHFLCVALAPSLLYIIATRHSGSRLASLFAHRPFAVSSASLLVLTVLHILVFIIVPDSRIVMPWSEVSTSAGVLRYTLFSSWHLADILNLLLLLAPMAVVVVLLVPLFRDTAKQSDTGLATARIFSLLSVLFAFAFIFFANTSLGLARDWDVAATLGTTILFAALLFAERPDNNAVLFIGFISLLFTLPWLSVHLLTSAGSARFERILRLDDEHMYGDYALSGYEALRKYHQHLGNPVRDIDITERMIELVGYPAHYRELSETALVLFREDPEEYDRVQQWMLTQLLKRARLLQEKNTDRDHAITLYQIDSLSQGIGIQALTRQIPFPEALLRNIAKVTRGGTDWHGISGMLAYADGDYHSAIEQISTAFTSGFSSPVLSLFYGNALALVGEYSKALQALEQGVALFPGDWMLHFTLAKYYVRAGIEPDRAVDLLNRCAELGVPGNKTDEFTRLLQSLQ